MRFGSMWWYERPRAMQVSRVSECPTAARAQPQCRQRTRRTSLARITTIGYLEGGSCKADVVDGAPIQCLVQRVKEVADQ